MPSGYPSDWDTRRRKVYQRDGYTCQKCGRQGGPNGSHELHADHVQPKSWGGSNDMSNLQTLCRRCHTKKTQVQHGVGLSDMDSSMAPSTRAFLFTLCIGLLGFFVVVFIAMNSWGHAIQTFKTGLYALIAVMVFSYFLLKRAFSP